MAETRELQHAEDCYPGDTCVQCGGCDCGLVPSTCDGPGCYPADEHDQWIDENGGHDSCAYGCH